MSNSHRAIATTPALLALPPRKKARLDPAVLKARVERKTRKLQREIEKLLKEPRQPIPILEYQYSNSELRDLKSRPGRTFADAGLDESTLRGALKLWSFYRNNQKIMEMKSLKQVEAAQENALRHLKAIDEELYIRTVSKNDLTLIPYISNHMRKETPANQNYQPPDGYIKDITKDWVM